VKRQTWIIGSLRFCAHLPLPLLHGLGVLLGWLAWLTPNRLRRVAATNIAVCFPDWDPAARARLLRRNLAETGKAVMELGPLWFRAGSRVLKLVREVEGEEAWLRSLQQGRGGIGITPHLGAWEIAGLYISSRRPATILYRPSKVDIDAVLVAGRERLGARMVATDSRGVRRLFQALRAGELVCVLPDQDPGREAGIFAPFFGQAANTMVLLSRLAMKNNSPVSLGYAERLSWGRGYRITIEPLPPVVGEGPLEVSVAAVNAAVEKAVRRCPEQYLWSYKRFKTRPPGAPVLY
jgi:KDO2-lipid IV(A) lauroyltransferase